MSAITVQRYGSAAAWSGRASRRPCSPRCRRRTRAPVRRRRGIRRPPQPADQHDARRDQRDAAPPARPTSPRPAPGADGEHEHRRRAARQRIDDAQVAALQRAGERRDVADLERGRGGDVGPGRRAATRQLSAAGSGEQARHRAPGRPRSPPRCRARARAAGSRSRARPPRRARARPRRRPALVATATSPGTALDRLVALARAVEVDGGDAEQRARDRLERGHEVGVVLARDGEAVDREPERGASRAARRGTRRRCRPRSGPAGRS